MSKNKLMYTFMLYIMAKFTKYIIRTFLVENPDTGQKYSYCNSVLNFKFLKIQTEGLGAFFKVSVNFSGYPCMESFLTVVVFSRAIVQCDIIFIMCHCVPNILSGDSTVC